MNDYQIARTQVERILGSGKGKEELCREIRISAAAMDYFLAGSLRLPAGVVQRIYRFLDQEAVRQPPSVTGNEQTVPGAEEVAP